MDFGLRCGVGTLLGRGRRGRLGGISLLVPLLLLTLLAPAASAQVATFSIGTTIQGPALVTAGDQDLPGALVLTNNSTGLGPLTLTSITYHPSCASFDLACTSPEPAAFSLGPVAVGSAGTGCGGTVFSVSSDAAGRYTFTASPAIVLATTGSAGSNCTINFTFNVLRVPTTDAQPGTPGVQTTRSAIVQGTAPATAGGTVNGTSRSIATITVVPFQPTITTQVAASTIAQGAAASDTATVTGSPNVVVTGTVTFNLYGPNDASCGGSPVFSSTVVLTGGSATSASFAPTVAGTYRWRGTYNGNASNATVSGPCNATNETVEVLPAGRYEPLTPFRILDTRIGIGGISNPIGSGETVAVQVTGVGGVPASGVTAVGLNVTVTQPTGSGFMTIYPTGSARPNAANLNFTPDKTVPNLVMVKVGTGGRVDMFNSSGLTHVIYDVAGYFTDTTVGGDGRYEPLLPARILDTRLGIGGTSVRLGPDASLDLQVSGQGGVPAVGAEAVVLNIAVTNTTAAGFLTVFPTGEGLPNAANLNWAPGDTVANRVVAKLGAGGKVTIYNNAGLTDLVVDVNGSFTNGIQRTSGSVFVPLNPARILDTRIGIGGVSGARPAGSSTDIQIAGQGGIPAVGVSAVALNATVVSPTGPGFLALFPAGTSRPPSSDLNFSDGEIRPNLVVAKLSPDGKITLFTSATADLVFDVAGFFP